MSHFGLPPAIAQLFEPRPPLGIVPPPPRYTRRPISGLSSFLDEFEAKSERPPPPENDLMEPIWKRRERRRKDRMEHHAAALAERAKHYSPKDDPNAADTDPNKTLFVGRLNFETSERKLKKEFEEFGKIRKVKIVKDKKGKPFGFGFIEFEKSSDMRAAYKQADGKKIDDRRVVVDIERARTVKGWLPRRLGGGVGPGRKEVLSKKELKKSEGGSSLVSTPSRSTPYHPPGYDRPSDRDDRGGPRYGYRDRGEPYDTDRRHDNSRGRSDRDYGRSNDREGRGGYDRERDRDDRRQDRYRSRDDDQHRDDRRRHQRDHHGSSSDSGYRGGGANAVPLGGRRSYNNAPPPYEHRE